MIFRRFFFFLVLSLFFISVVQAKEFTGFVFPDSGGTASSHRVSIKFGESWQDSTNKNYIGHLGEDFLGSSGEPLYAIADGIVEAVKDWPNCPISKNHGWGPVVIIKHTIDDPKYFNSDGTMILQSSETNPNVVYALYGHVGNVKVKTGDIVKKGQQIGEMSYVCNYVEHLHFEIKDQQGEDTDFSMNGGPGKGYSGTDNSAPHRYSPSKFIELNKNLVVNDKPKVVPTPTSSNEPSIFARLLSFIKDLFSSDATQEQTTPESVQPETKPNVKVTYNAQILNTQESKQAQPGEEIHLEVKAKNTGTGAWERNATSLNVSGGQSANAKFKHSSWITNLRPALLSEQSVAGGLVGVFPFTIVAPSDPGTYTFRVMIVHKIGSEYSWLGTEMYTLTLNVEGQEEIEPIVEAPQEVKGIKEYAEELFEGVDNTVKKVHNLFTGTSVYSTNESVPTDTPTSTEDRVEILSPAVTVIFPSSSVWQTMATNIVIEGTLNTSTAFILVNNLQTNLLAINTNTLTWSMPVNLELATNTFTFVAWDANAATSSPPVSIEIIRLLEDMVTLNAPVITNPPTSSLWYTSSTPVLISGTKDDDIISLVATTSPSDSSVIVEQTTSTWQASVNEILEGQYLFELYGQDEKGNSSPTSSVDFVYDKTLPAVSSLQVDPVNGILFVLYAGSDEVSGIDHYDVQFNFPIYPYPDDRSSICPDSSSIFKPSDDPIFANADDFWNYLDEHDCVWFTSVISSTSTEFDLSNLDVDDMDILVRVRAVDRAGNVGAWNTSDIETFTTVQTTGNIIFSEVGWAGTIASDDHEWFELFNYDKGTIHLDGWKVTWRDNEISLGNIDIMKGKSIVFERGTVDSIIDRRNQLRPQHYDGSVDMNDGGEYLRLIDPEGTVIDEVNASNGWFGNHGQEQPKETMIRRGPPTSGNEDDSWCSYTDCMKNHHLNIVSGRWYDFEDTQGNIIWGTPGNFPYSEL
jgi:murein DD-endopeptidase MepM/ murein hydrolase activator NlpD